MIAIDSSAIVAILRDEAQADALAKRSAAEPYGQGLMPVASYLEVGAVGGKAFRRAAKSDR